MCVSQSIKHIWIHLIGLNTSLWPWEQGGTGRYLESDLPLKKQEQKGDSRLKQEKQQLTRNRCTTYMYIDWSYVQKLNCIDGVCKTGKCYIDTDEADQRNYDISHFSQTTYLWVFIESGSKPTALR